MPEHGRNMKRGIPLLLLLLVCATAYWHWRPQKTPPARLAPVLALPSRPATASQASAEVVSSAQTSAASPALTPVAEASSGPGPGPKSTSKAVAELAPLSPELASLPPMTVLEN